MTEERPSAAILPFRRRPKSRTYRQRIVRALEWLEDQREHLIAELDAVDPDPDLEANGDEEPSLGFTEPLIPTHPWGKPIVDQSQLCRGSRDDLEDEHDGREEKSFGEPPRDDKPGPTPEGTPDDPLPVFRGPLLWRNT